MQQVVLKDFNQTELEAWVESIGERRFRARQLFNHLYVRKIASWDECTDLSKSFRTQLEMGARVDALELAETHEAEDGAVKYVFRLADGERIESVLIPDPPRYTLCVSSQAGCAMGCGFCFTGGMGFKRNLTPGEIIDQVVLAQRAMGSKPRISNIVFMGMGEPLANYDAVSRSLAIMLDPSGLAFSHRRITVSTAGLIPQLKKLGEDSPVNLAISLHAPDDELRSQLMPINKKYPLAELIAACRDYPVPNRKRITFEYLLIKGVNDTPQHAKKLIKLLHGVRAKVNLITFNPFPGCDFEKPLERDILAFQEVLTNTHITATLRRSRGEDILAACGQLAGR